MWFVCVVSIKVPAKAKGDNSRERADGEEGKGFECAFHGVCVFVCVLCCRIGGKPMAPEGANGLASAGPIAAEGPAFIAPRFLRVVIRKGQVNLGAIPGKFPIGQVDARPVVARSVEQVSEAGEASQFAGDGVEVVGVHRVCVSRQGDS